MLSIVKIRKYEIQNLLSDPVNNFYWVSRQTLKWLEDPRINLILEDQTSVLFFSSLIRPTNQRLILQNNMIL